MDLTWLNDIASSRSAIVYIVFSLIGLYSSVFLIAIGEKRMFQKYDFFKLLGFIPVVVGMALLIGISPFISFFIGLAPERLYTYILKKGASILQLPDEVRPKAGDKDNKPNGNGNGGGNGSNGHGTGGKNGNSNGNGAAAKMEMRLLSWAI